MSSLRLLILAAVFPVAAFAVGRGLCGHLNLSQMNNAEITNVVTLARLSLKASAPAAQCDLFPGEALPICGSCSPHLDDDAMRVLRPIMGEKTHLAWHAAWHRIREYKELDEDTFKQLGSLGFVPKTWSPGDFRAHLQGGTLAGEDFLYMHRLMLKMVESELSAAGLPCMTSWTSLPETVQDSEWPVPRALREGKDLEAISDKLVIFKTQLAQLSDVERLRRISTLNRLGQIIEPLFHQDLHGFYRDPHGCSAESVTAGTCDDLVPVESSPLNRYFWKIHSLIDQIVGRWLRAHGYREIAVDCAGREGCYQWQGTWIGKYPDSEPK